MEGISSADPLGLEVVALTVHLLITLGIFLAWLPCNSVWFDFFLFLIIHRMCFLELKDDTLVLCM